VKEIQRLLNARGVTDARGRPLAVDGRLGTLTRQAIKNYQDQYPALKTDGILGRHTLTQMVRNIEDVPATAAANRSLSTSDMVAAIAGGPTTSPLGQVAAGFGLDVAKGFAGGAVPTGGVPSVRTSYPFGPPGPESEQRYFDKFGMTPHNAMTSTSPALTERTGINRGYSNADQMDAENILSSSGGKLGTSRGLGFETLDKEGDVINNATGAFARSLAEDRQRDLRPSRLDFASLDNRRKPFEFQFGGAGDAFQRDSSGQRVFSRAEAGSRSGSGAGNPSRAVSKVSGFTSMGTGGFTGRPTQQAPSRGGSGSGSQGAAGRTGQAGTGQSSRPTSQASPSRSTVNRDPAASNKNKFGGPR
jgi:hypothetical protein